jgi:'Cold-shock' DNA-binding domain
MGDTIFMHISNVQPGLWRQLTNGHRIKFSLAFSFRGPSAFDVESAAAIMPMPRQLDLLLGKVQSAIKE